MAKQKKRELLFTLTAKDFKWEFYKSSGPGGQNKNKRDTACRCIHPESGAIGNASEERSQGQNRKQAFIRCVESEKFKAWHRLECNYRLLTEQKKKEIAEYVEREMSKEENFLIEVKDSSGNWIREEK